VPTKPDLPKTAHPSGDKRFKLLDVAVKRHQSRSDALIEVLHAAQELFGFLDDDVLIYVGRSLGVPLSRVYGVATFYNFFSLKPRGEHTCVVCLGTACYVKGSGTLLKALESELFGHEAGSFTGAQGRHKGKFESADGGTVFLDEIGEVAPKVQIDLLRVLEEKTVTRLGGNTPVPVDFRVIAATNRDLPDLVKSGQFREDLYWRLNVVTVALPPLRDRREDVLLLALDFLARFAGAMGRRPMTLSPEVRQALLDYSWPGNVRELQNAIERAVVVSSGDTIEMRDLTLRVASGAARPGPGSLAEAEKAHVFSVLESQDWNISRAARVLDVDRVTLYNKIKRYGLKKTEEGSERRAADS
jgi:DNA-binding NtrC family response regulator